MSKPAHYSTCVDNPPKGIKKVQTFGSFSQARDRARELAKINLVAVVYETNEKGAARTGAEPLFVARPVPVRQSWEKPAKPAKEPAAAAKPAEAAKPARTKAAK